MHASSQLESNLKDSRPDDNCDRKTGHEADTDWIIWSDRAKETWSTIDNHRHVDQLGINIVQVWPEVEDSVQQFQTCSSCGVLSVAGVQRRAIVFQKSGGA